MPPREVLVAVGSVNGSGVNVSGKYSSIMEEISSSDAAGNV